MVKFSLITKLPPEEVVRLGEEDLESGNDKVNIGGRWYRLLEEADELAKILERRGFYHQIFETEILAVRTLGDLNGRTVELIAAEEIAALEKEIEAAGEEETAI